jgi:NAD-dependent DNA ligase
MISMKERRFFIYRNFHNEIKPHDVVVIQSDERHFGAMHHERGFLTFRHDGVLEYVNTPEELAAHFHHYEQNPPPIQKPRVVKHRNPSELPEICFTGFKSEDKNNLIEAARRKFHVASNVTGKLEYLVCGFRAGPSKVAKASAQGVQLITEDEFRFMISN